MIVCLFSLPSIDVMKYTMKYMNKMKYTDRYMIWLGKSLVFAFILLPAAAILKFKIHNCNHSTTTAGATVQVSGDAVI